VEEVLSSRPTPRRELPQLVSEHWTSPNVEDTSRELSRILCTIQVEAHHSQRLFSETSTNSSNTLSFSSQLRACIPASSFMLDPKLPLPWATFFQWLACQKVPSSQVLRPSRETVEPSPELLVPPLSSLVTPRMARELELDSHPVLENLSSQPAEVWLEFAPVVRELISHFLRLTELTTRLMPRRETGQELEVLL